MALARMVDDGVLDGSPQERILAAARDLFCRDGIAATGIDRVLSEARASKMTLYSRFGSKEALVQAVLAQEGREWRDAFFAAVTGTASTPCERLSAVVPALGQWFQGGRFYGCAFMNAAAERTKGPAAENDWLRVLTRQHHQEILSFLERLIGDAGLADPGTLARQMLLVIDGAIAALMVTGQAAVLETASLTMNAVLAAAKPNDENRGTAKPIDEF